MIIWILAALAVFFVQTLLPSMYRYRESMRTGLGSAIDDNLGPRDNLGPLPVKGERAKRALNNMFEALPIFLTLAILAVILGAENGVALWGAGAFVLARMAYIPCYVQGIYGVRTLVWGIGHFGLVLMAAAVVCAITIN